MNSQDNNQIDSRLDELLAARPLRASDSFADQTLARLAALEAASDAQLDTLLSRHTVTTRDSFTEQTLARLAETPADEKIDELIAASPVVAAPGFTEKTVERVNRDSAPTHRQRWLASVAGLAAAVAIAFVTNLPTSQPAQPVVHNETASTADATTDKALALANGLSGADGLLDAETMELLSLLSDQSGI